MSKTRNLQTSRGSGSIWHGASSWTRSPDRGSCVSSSLAFRLSLDHPRHHRLQSRPLLDLDGHHVTMVQRCRLTRQRSRSRPLSLSHRRHRRPMSCRHHGQARATQGGARCVCQVRQRPECLGEAACAAYPCTELERRSGTPPVQVRQSNERARAHTHTHVHTRPRVPTQQHTPLRTHTQTDTRGCHTTYHMDWMSGSGGVHRLQGRHTSEN